MTICDVATCRGAGMTHRGYSEGTGGESRRVHHRITAPAMRIRTTSQLAKHARWAVFNVQSGEIVELHLTRAKAQSACDEMHQYAGVTNWMRVGRNPGFQVALPTGTDLMAMSN